MKVWITKYALTYGIVVTRGKHHPENDKWVVTPAIWHGSSGGLVEEQEFYHLDWHLSQEAAIRRANKMKEMAIHKLENRLAKLTSMANFTIVQVTNNQGGFDGGDGA